MNGKKIRGGLAPGSLLVMLVFGIWFGGLSSDVCAAPFDYAMYQQFLDRYVVAGKYIEGIKLNVVDYDAIHKDQEKRHSLYGNILQQLAVFDPDMLQNREEEIAFWINTYNVGAIKMIIDHYSVDSIRSRKINWLRNPWGIKILTIGNNAYSLGQIEHEILIAKYKDPLIHFAIVCASLSCPDLSPQAYEGSQLKEQLQRQARQFLQNTKKGLRIRKEDGVVFFSQIFRFDKESFPNGATDAILLIAPFVDDKEDREFLMHPAQYTIKYLDYNWDLNTLSSVQ
jgi:hypothetical protein